MKAIGLALVGIWLVAFVLAMSAVAGGSQPNGSGSRAGTATILLGDFQFSPNRIDAKVGVPLTVRMPRIGSKAS